MLINLSLRPFRNDNLYRLIYASCVAVLVLVSLGSLTLITRHGWALLRLRSALGGQRAGLSTLEARERGLEKELAAIDSATLQKRADFANAAILNRVFSWTQLFNELEKVVPPEVRLRSVRPTVGSKGKVDVYLEGTAKDYGAFVDLEESLMGSSSFSRVYPGSEHLESPAYRPGGPPLPLPGAQPGASAPATGELSFNLSFEYFPGGKPSAQGAATGGAGK